MSCLIHAYRRVFPAAAVGRRRRSAGDVLELELHLHEEDGDRSDHGNLIRESDKSPPEVGIEMSRVFRDIFEVKLDYLSLSPPKKSKQCEC